MKSLNSWLHIWILRSLRVTYHHRMKSSRCQAGWTAHLSSLKNSECFPAAAFDNASDPCPAWSFWSSSKKDRTAPTSISCSWIWSWHWHWSYCGKKMSSLIVIWNFSNWKNYKHCSVTPPVMSQTFCSVSRFIWRCLKGLLFIQFNVLSIKFYSVFAAFCSSNALVKISSWLLPKET